MLGAVGVAIAPLVTPLARGAGTTARPRTNWLWAELMQRTFGFDVLACPRCQARLELIALIEDPRVIRRILNHLGLPTEVPTAGPVRAPPLPLGLSGSVVRRRSQGGALSAGDPRHPSGRTRLAPAR